MHYSCIGFSFCGVVLSFWFSGLGFVLCLLIFHHFQAFVFSFKVSFEKVLSAFASVNTDEKVHGVEVNVTILLFTLIETI